MRELRQIKNNIENLNFRGLKCRGNESQITIEMERSITGLTKKIDMVERRKREDSFINNLTASANDCRSPE